MPPSERNEGGCQPGMPGASVGAGAEMFGSAAECCAYVGEAGLIDRRYELLALPLANGRRTIQSSPSCCRKWAAGAEEDGGSW